MGGQARHQGRGALLTSNLPQLQNLIKRDPAGYREEFLQQLNHYESMRRLFELQPDEEGERFREVLGFIAQVSQCYPKETKEFPAQLSTLLLDHHATLNPETRKSIVQNLVMLRNKDVIPSIELLRTLFPLLSILTSAPLRSSIRKTILTDIRTANAKTKNHKLNRMVQALLFGMVERGMGGDVEGSRVKGKGKKHEDQDAKGGEAMWAVVLVKELWRKGIWNDPKTVAIVALACNHPNTKVQSAAIHFFLGSENEDEEDSDEEEAPPNIRKLQHQMTINKKSKTRERQMTKAIKSTKQKRKEKADAAGVTPNFPALQLLHDPQSFGEKLYDGLSRHDKHYTLDHKVLIMQLLSRVMGAHKLCVLGFYSYIIKYLTHHQLQITLILVSLAQSVHDLTPPDILTPVVRKIASEFVHPGVGSEVVSAGINAIREVCKRQPWCMEEDLLGDLIEYRKSRDKGVVTASRGLLQLFREVNPGLLKRRERGKAASMGMSTDQVPEYGHSRGTAEGIDGLNLLEQHLAGKPEGEDGEGEDDDAAWDEWSSDSGSDSDSEDGWQNVDSDSDAELDISDSDDEEEDKTRRQLKKEQKEKRQRMMMGEKEVQEVLPKRKVKAGEEDEEESGEEDGAQGEGGEMDDGKSEAAVSEATAPEVKGGQLDPSVGSMSQLATQKILTPADFALISTLRLQAATEAANNGGGSAAKRKLALLESQKKHSTAAAALNEANEGFVNEGDIMGPRKKVKENYEERMASIAKGREGRDKFGSAKGKKKAESHSSSTNKEKKRNKPLMMALHSRGVVMKKKQSLREKQQNLRKHIEAQKKMKH